MRFSYQKEAPFPIQPSERRGCAVSGHFGRADLTERSWTQLGRLSSPLDPLYLPVDAHQG